MSPERRSRLERFVPTILVAALFAWPLIGEPTILLDSRRDHRVWSVTRPGLNVKDARRGGRSGVDLSAYRDLGSWIDIYNRWPWKYPVLAMRKLDRRGVRTVFLQTSNYSADVPLFRPRRIAKFLRAAHRRGIQVVAWYVPSFKHPREDFYKARAAIRFKGRGQRFDSFALDIEAAEVGNVWVRNQRLLELSRDIRQSVGRQYALGAITPDPVKAIYWPDFPYERVRRLYDVFVPMGYFSFRTAGYRNVKRYTSVAIRNIRRESGDPNVPIHFIGGIGGDTGPPDVKGFVRAAKGHEVLGASYYDFSATTDREWSELEALDHQRKVRTEK